MPKPTKPHFVNQSVCRSLVFQAPPKPTEPHFVNRSVCFLQFLKRCQTNQIPDFNSRFQISYFCFRISDFRCQVPYFGFHMSYLRFQIYRGIFQISNVIFQNSECRYPISNFIFQVSDFRFPRPQLSSPDHNSIRRDPKVEPKFDKQVQNCMFLELPPIDFQLKTELVASNFLNMDEL